MNLSSTFRFLHIIIYYYYTYYLRNNKIDLDSIHQIQSEEY